MDGMNSKKIANLVAREILDSRGIPTIEVDVILHNGIIGRASVPSGASIGVLEAVEKRDKDSSRYLGKGVLSAIHSVMKMKEHLIGYDVCDQCGIDDLLIFFDGIDTRENLGSNAILGISLAAAIAAAKLNNVPLYRYIQTITKTECTLPLPMMNVINGGVHSNNNLSIQEFMLFPQYEEDFSEIIRKSAEVFYALKKLLSESGYSIGVGDEGGFAPSFSDTYEVLDILVMAIEFAGYKLGDDFKFSLDCAASEFKQEDGLYKLDNKLLSSDELIDYYDRLIQKYPISSIEDAMSEDDIDGWKAITKKLSKDVMLVGDDLFVTNVKQLKHGIKNGMANAILIKPNQVGTISETLATIMYAKEHEYKTIISHRSGETEDVSIVHLAVGTDAGYIKTGSLSRCDRTAKYNELLRIYQKL